MTQENLAENVIQIYRQYGRQWMDLRGTYLYKRVQRNVWEDTLTRLFSER